MDNEQSNSTPNENVRDAQPGRWRKKHTIMAVIVAVLVFMGYVPLWYGKTGLELLHAYYRYSGRKAKLEKFHVRDTIQTYEKFLNVELTNELEYERYKDSIRRAETNSF